MKKESTHSTGKTKNLTRSEKKLGDKIGPVERKQEKVLSNISDYAHKRQDKSMKREG